MRCADRIARRAARSAAIVALLAVAGARAARAQETMIRGFTNVDYRASDDSAGQKGFNLGQYDLFITSRLTERWSFLGETVFEFDPDINDFHVDVERVVIGYTINNHFRVDAGKHHNPLGYWNTAYHHGAVMQPTIDRPPLVAFEDDGGPLPIHTTGVMASGRDLGPAHLGVDVLLGNGIGATADGDNNNAKSVTVAVSSQVTSQIQVGVNGYLDHLAAGTQGLGLLALAEPMRQSIVGGYAALMGSALEGIAEYQHIANAPSGLSTTSNDGFFVYGGYRVGRWVTYARYDQFDVAAADPYYFGMPSYKGGLVGGRWDFSAMTTGKLELRRNEPTGSKKVNELAAQIAIGF